jgi:hypothetical protein
MTKLPFEDGDAVRLKVMALYLSPTTDGSFECRKPNPGPEDPCQFIMVRKGSQAWAFSSVQRKRYITVTADGSVLCNASVPLRSETFVLRGCDPRHVQFENQANGRLLEACVSAGDQVGRLVCSGSGMGEGKTDFEIERQ